MAGRLIILTGASGNGKTTIAQAMQQAKPACDVLYFDSVGVPSTDEMRKLGGGEAWQRATTLEWMQKIALLLGTGCSVLLEGQMRIAFIQEGLDAQKIKNAHVLLVDCDDEVRSHRLRHDRLQPELADANMMNWAQYLREEAGRANCGVLDTGAMPVAASVALLVAALDQ